MPEENVSGEERARLSHSHVGRYAVIWIALVLFTFLTWALSRLHLGGGWGIVVALTIAITKSTLVALFFMHLWDQRGVNRLVFVTALVFVSLLIGLTILDNATRFQLANPPGSAGALPAGGASRPPRATPAREAAAAMPAGPGAQLHTVQITGFKFVPAELEVNAGDIVEWTNEDFVAHTATADDKTFDTGQIEGGASKRIAVQAKGQFSYFCRNHPTMRATLIVR